MKQERKAAGCVFWTAKRMVFPKQNELASFRSFKQHFVLFGKAILFAFRPKNKAGDFWGAVCFANARDVLGGF